MIGKQTSKQRLKTTDATKKTLLYLLSNEGGFTIVESLVAILVVSILLAAIAPVLSLSVATRVQSRRVEFATQAAKAYIDGVRTQKITAPPETTATYTTATNPAPTATGTLTCSANSYCTAPTSTTSALYCVDFDSTNSCESNSLTDVVVQAFRYNASNNNTSNPSVTGYTLGLRVYRADAFKSSATLLKNNPTKNTQNPFTAGVGQKTAPLVEMTADISDIVPKYSDLCARFSGGCN
jgi:prepilin-type N-terminal cleavage/methylation domain-containing protein